MPVITGGHPLTYLLFVQDEEEDDDDEEDDDEDDDEEEPLKQLVFPGFPATMVHNGDHEQVVKEQQLSDIAIYHAVVSKASSVGL